MKKIVTIGGGTGSFVVLRGLKEIDASITAIVNMYDSGGSSGILRDELGVLPPGDVRRALLALSEGAQAKILRDLLNYRFEHGAGLAGHNFGNLLLVALSSLYGGDAIGIEKASELLSVRGAVLPVSLDKSHVHAVLEDGQEIVGETNIDIPKHDPHLKIKRVFLDPPARIYRKAAQAIAEAETIVICPGDMYSSLVPTLRTDGMKDALRATRAKIVWVCNLMTKHGETDEFAASDFARELLSYSGLDMFDAIVLNTRPIASEVLEGYARMKQFPVQYDRAQLQAYGRTIIAEDILSRSELVRFDSERVARIIFDL